MKYEITDITMGFFGRTLHRIKALRDFGDVEAGELGGWIEREENLSQDGDAWVDDDAKVYDSAHVYGDAWVYDDAQVCGNARVSDDASVFGNAYVYGNAQVFGNARVYGNAYVYGDARVFGEASVHGNASVFGNARVSGKGYVRGNALIQNTRDMLQVGPLGSKYDFATFFMCADGLIRVCCGCFYGTIAEFTKRVKEIHGDSKYGREYRLAAELAKEAISG